MQFTVELMDHHVCCSAYFHSGHVTLLYVSLQLLDQFTLTYSNLVEGALKTLPYIS